MSPLSTASGFDFFVRPIGFEDGHSKRVEHLPDLDHLLRQRLPLGERENAIVSSELESVVDFEGGLDADVEIPRQFLPSRSAAALDDVAGDGICRAKELRLELGVASGEGPDDSLDLEVERMRAMPHRLAPEVLHVLTMQPRPSEGGTNSPRPGPIQREGSLLMTDDLRLMTCD